MKFIFVKDVLRLRPDQMEVVLDVTINEARTASKGKQDDITSSDKRQGQIFHKKRL